MNDGQINKQKGIRNKISTQVRVFNNFSLGTALTMPWSFFPCNCFLDVTFLDLQIMKSLKFSVDTVYFVSNFVSK